MILNVGVEIVCLYFTLLYLTLPYLTLPYLTLPYFTLPYLNVTCLCLCLTLTYLTLPVLLNDVKCLYPVVLCRGSLHPIIPILNTRLYSVRVCLASHSQ
jgi:hypothetical protein